MRPLLRFSRHARRRMLLRSISAEEISEALAAPEVSYASEEFPETRTIVLGAAASGRRLKVVVLVEDPRFIVTVADRDEEG